MMLAFSHLSRFRFNIQFYINDYFLGYMNIIINQNYELSFTTQAS